MFEQQTQTISHTILDVPVYEAIRPDGPGSLTQLAPYPGGSSNWDCVNEEEADGDGTYVEGESNQTEETDLYATQNHTESGVITKVTVWVTCKATDAFMDAPTARTVIMTHSTIYAGDLVNLTTSYVHYSTEYAANPFTGVTWTWDEIDSLEIGVGCRCNSSGEGKPRCTRAWAVIEIS